MTMLASRQGMYRTTGASSGGQRTSKSDSRPHALLVCRTLIEESAFIPAPEGRYQYQKQEKNTPFGPRPPPVDSKKNYIPAAADLFGLGIRKIVSGDPIQKYRRGTRCNWNLGEAQGSLNDEDDDDYLVDPLANGTGLAGGDFDDDVQ